MKNIQFFFLFALSGVGFDDSIRLICGFSRRVKVFGLAFGKSVSSPNLMVPFIVALFVLCPVRVQAQDTFNRILGGSGSGLQGDQTNPQVQSQGTDRISPSGGTESSSTSRSIWDSLTSQKDKDGRATGIMSFYLKHPGTVKVRTSFDFGPMATYGLIKTPMIRDVNGWVMGGYAEKDDKETRMAGAYHLFVEKWDPDFETWRKYADHPAHKGGFYSIPTEGYYRLAVLPLEKTVFALAPASTTVTVEDPAKDRTGKLIIYRIDVKPLSTSGVGGVRLDCDTLPKYDHGAGFTPEYPTYTFRAEVYRGIVVFESEMNAQTSPRSGPEPYTNPFWRLIRFEGKSGMKVLATGRGPTFSFNTGYWGCGPEAPLGRYEIEAHLAEKDQASGISQHKVRPGTYSITLFNCGKGRHKAAEPKEAVFEGSITKDCEVEGSPGF